MEPKSTKVVPLDALVEQIRAVCIQAALDGYETAAADGLCAEGAWECAVDAMRHVDLATLAQGAADQTSSR
ncbi:MAG: acetyltransferase [Caldilineaceae bacterium]|nr:acetyltransferase [Caldilineaceae bacterium]